MSVRRIAPLAVIALLASCSLKMPSGGGTSGSSSSGSNGDNGAASGSNGSANGGSTSGSSFAAFPLVTPPVKAAAPKGFGGAMGGNHRPTPKGRFLTLDTNDIRSRFFSMGPTNVYGLLGSIDGRIQGYNMRAQNGAPACMQAEPVAYTIHPFGADVPFYAQCVDKIGSSDPNDPGFVQFGTKDGVIYYYSAVGAGWTAAILTPNAQASATDGGADEAGADAGDAGAGTTYRVHAWSGVGYLNADGCGNKGAFDDCSYGVIELVADASTGTFEMAVAGIGFGYCGAQLKSNGTLVYGLGSSDMGQTCNEEGSFCVQASDVMTPADCSGDAVQMFALTPLGRRESVGSGLAHTTMPDAGAAWGASQYPGAYANQVVLDGTATDSLHFGPTTPTPGVASFN